MLFISAQPDDHYFLWQLELQLLNLHELGVNKEDIHVLVGYQTEKGIDVEYESFSRENPFANFFFYPDQRKSSDYLSSIRPHLLKQHFKKYPHLGSETIFYHDSDILFHHLPVLKRLSRGKSWFVSDAKYISADYIQNVAGKSIFNGMCQIVGVNPNLVRKNDPNAGGAQYIIKDVDYLFWDKVERDSEVLYKFLSQHNHKEAEKYHRETGKPISKYQGIQAWCADMWALLWNGWLYEHPVKIDKELDFCWPYDKYSTFGKKKILHYTGSMNPENKKIFAKTRYVNYPPYYDSNLDQIDKGTCSYVVKQKIDKLINYKNRNRFDLREVSFLFPVEVNSEQRKKNILLIIKYIFKYFDTKIILLGIGGKKGLQPEALPDNVTYIYQKRNEKQINQKILRDEIIHKTHSSILFLFDIATVLPIEQIVEAVEVVRKGQGCFIVPFNRQVFKVDQLFNEIFGRLLDPEVLHMNRGKFDRAKLSSCGCIVMRKNDFFKSNTVDVLIDGYKDKDMIKRLNIKKGKVKYISGDAFSLWKKD